MNSLCCEYLSYLWIFKKKIIKKKQIIEQKINIINYIETHITNISYKPINIINTI